MQGYSKGSVGPLATVHYKGYLGACMLGYSKGIVRTFRTVHYIGYIEDSMQGYRNGKFGALHDGAL
jgi:hypothetical protein